MDPHPLVCAPLIVPKVWGGRRLSQWGKDLPPDTDVGESWEIADLPERVERGRSVISAGPLAGQTLRDAITANHEAIMGTATLVNDGFPLLVKFLDAATHLSLQVHPDEEYAAAHEDAYLKSEAWVILEAEVGSVIFRGLKEGVAEADLRAAITANCVEDVLNAVEVTPGECYWLPSGTCHALGGGVLVAEVQTPSDTTFRLHDWGREGRAMHLEAAMECIHWGPPPPVVAERPLASGDLLTTPLATTSDFTIERIAAMAATVFELVVDEAPAVLMVTEGSGVVRSDGPVPTLDAPRGTTILVPASLQGAQLDLEEGASVLRIDLPSQQRLA